MSSLLVPEWEVPDQIDLSDDEARLVAAVEDVASRFGVPPIATRHRKKAPSDHSNLLRDFIVLDGEPKRTLRFAQKWGLLGLCQHRLPATHRSAHRLGQIHLALGHIPPSADLTVGKVPERVLSRESKAWRRAVPDLWPCRPVSSEGLEDWWFWSRHAAAITTAATRLGSGAILTKDQIEQVTDLHPAVRPEQVFTAPPAEGAHNLTPAEIATAQRHHMTRIAQQWLELADVTIAIDWSAGSVETAPASKPVLGYQGNGLFAALAIEIALACTGSKKFYICSKCSTPYPRKRAVQAGKNGYCDDCKKAGAQATWRANHPEGRVKENEKRKARSREA